MDISVREQYNVFRKKTQIKKPWYPFMRYGWYPLEWNEAERSGILSTATGGILWSAMGGIFWVILSII